VNDPPYQYAKSRPGAGDRILKTWDPHGVLDEFFVDINLELPTGKDAYVNAQQQYDWLKKTLDTPDLLYTDLLRLAEVWAMGAPVLEVRPYYNDHLI
jgi:hypothetical protein